MEREIRRGLSRSDFGEFKREEYKDGKFNYSLIRYERFVVMINSEEWHETIKENKAVPGSIAIEFEKILRYKTDPDSKQRVKDAHGNDVLEETGRWGWTLIAVKNITQITAEALIEGQKDALEYDKQAIVLTSKNKAAMLEMEYMKIMTLSPEFTDKLKNHLLLDDDTDENDLGTEGTDSGTNGQYPDPADMNAGAGAEHPIGENSGDQVQ